MSKQTFRVDGMTCGGCASSVERALKARAEGVEVSVDLAAKTVSVDGLDSETVRAAIDAAGFDFVGPA